ncbi:hypothetical protein AmaxDRAFT_2136 [Limnospira maxima CS-328]|uniref:Uncharacterized protein n=1 Tax=Limnospira maxima CS-328 TaxID=513049 RepID=B5W044_LIMMA|nr:hypothetical protein [Limnospira maxima]EDZ95223.1 hypothetical protein AmaxDRAFT_2136 [Limnospira maxima CS-328]MDC0838430.1 hypothetical protein [Limnoraphis robusta]
MKLRFKPSRNVASYSTLAISIAMAITLGLPGAASDNRFVQQVRQQLMQAGVALGISGSYQLSHEPYLGDIGHNQKDYLYLNLNSGSSYILVGVCDEDCRDIDLSLYDENNNLIDSDTALDDYPMVEVDPKWSGRFKVEVTMANCNASTCYYGVGGFCSIIILNVNYDLGNIWGELMNSPFFAEDSCGNVANCNSRFYG